MKRIAALLVLALAPALEAAELVRSVRSKISAGDIATGMAQVEDHRNTAGVDREYLDAVGWLARGAQMLGRDDLARQFIAELRREIPEERADTIVPYGAIIEVEGRILAEHEGRGAAIRHFERELARAKDTALRSRISKNINLLSLEGQPAPSIGSDALAGHRGKPVLLFFFAEWCGDCKAQAPSLGRIWQKYRNSGLRLVAVTRLYGGSTKEPYTPEQERAQVDKVWQESYSALDGVPIVISTDAMVRYGASATPTFALIDGNGIVRLYTPTRLSEAELSKRIEEVLAEAP